MTKKDISQRPCIVYKATNVANGYIYIGCTVKTLEYRMGDHFSKAKANYKGVFMDAIRQYGNKKFIFEILEKCDSVTQGHLTERYYIQKLKPEYNYATGGRGKGTPSRLRGRKLTEKHRNNMIEAQKHIDNRALLDSIRGDAIKKMSKKTLCINDDRTFSSCAEAARYYKIKHPRQVSKVCTGERNSIFGLKFKYIN